MMPEPDAPLPPPAAPSGSGVPRYRMVILGRKTSTPCVAPEPDNAGSWVRIWDHDRLVADLHAALAKSEQELDVAIGRLHYLDRYTDAQLTAVTRQRDALQGELDTLRLKLLEYAP